MARYGATNGGMLASVKVSVSIPDGDVGFLDDFARAHGLRSRSAVVQRAIRLLRASELSRHYEEAFAQWADDDEGLGAAVVANGVHGRSES